MSFLKRLPLMGFIALVGAGVAYFLLYVQPRQSYLVESDFQRLADIAERIDTQLVTYQQVVDNAGASPELLPSPLIGEVVEKGTKHPVTVGDEAETGRSFVWKSGLLVARLPVEEVVRRAFEPTSFDKLILAAGDGSILYQEGSGEIELTRLSGLGIEKDMDRLSLSSDLTDTRISGRSYKVFVRPCSTPRTPAPGGKGEGWMLLALMRSSQFHARSFEVSANWIIAAFGLALVALLSLPFLKLLTLGKGARLRAIDGLLAGLCSLIGVAVLTVLLLDQFVYQKLAAVESRQLGRLARSIHEELIAEIKSDLKDFDTLRDASVGKPRRLPAAPPQHRYFFWAAEGGEQLLKWTAHGRKPTAYINVGRRSYFQDALALARDPGRGLHLEGRRFSLEPVRSWTTGEDLVEIAMPFTAGEVQNKKGETVRSAVAALSTRMMSLHDPLPPGFDFAVIDSAGQVLFHSDPLRVLRNSNFLQGLRSRDLEALAGAGRSGLEQVRYLGSAHKVFLEPVPELSWSVLVFRDATLRATNVQIITTTLVCLILYALLFLALFSFVYVASSTRARWLWPMPSRQGTYLQLAIFYTGCLVGHLPLLRDGDPVFLLLNGMLIPLVVLFVSYMKIRLDQRLARRRLQRGRWEPLDGKLRIALLFVAGLLAASLFVGWRRLDLRTWNFILSALILGGVLLFHPRLTRLFNCWRTAPLRASYLASAALLLTVLTVLPAASFFKMACDVPIENMLKLGQRKLMLDGPSRYSYARIFFDTGAPRKPVLSQPVPCLGTQSSEIPCLGERPERPPHLPWMLELLEAIFPAYNESSRSLARLSPDTAPEWMWTWRHRPGRLRLDARPDLHIESLFPSLKPQGWDWLQLGLSGLVLCLAGLGLVWLMTQNLMLLGASSPQWLNRRRVYLGASAGHLLYISCRPERLQIRPKTEIFDLALHEEEIESRRILERPAPAGSQLVVVSRFEHRLEDRDFNRAKLELLAALVRDGGRRVILLSNQDPYLALASGVLYDGEDDPERETEGQDRWRRLLDRFALVDLDGRPQDARQLTEKVARMRHRLLAWRGKPRLVVKPDGDAPQDAAQPTSRAARMWNRLRRPLRWARRQLKVWRARFRPERIAWYRHVDGCLRVVCEECSPTSRLQEIGLRLLPDLQLGKTSPGDLVKEILARAEGYYADLWGSLSEEEQLVLVQLAEEGLVNPRNLRSLRRLIARGIVRRDPAPCLMNESFRLYVVGAPTVEKVRQTEARREKESAWAKLSAPITATLIGGILFFGFTQQETLKTTLGLVTVIAGAMPHLLQLVGYLGSSKAPLPPAR